MERINLPNGYIETSGLNDIKIISTIGDPVNVKFAAPEGVALGAVSWGILRSDGNIEEKVLFQGKVDERTRFLSDLKERAGEFTIHCHDGIKHYVNGEIRDDSSMVLVLMARHDMVWVNQLVTKENYPDGLPGWSGPIPNVPPPIVVPPPPTSDESYKGHKKGDFVALATSFGFESEDQNNYNQGKMTWPQVVEEMIKRTNVTDPG